MDFPEPSAVEALRLALDHAGDDWIATFRDVDGVAGLCAVSLGLQRACAFMNALELNG